MPPPPPYPPVRQAGRLAAVLRQHGEQRAAGHVARTQLGAPLLPLPELLLIVRVARVGVRVPLSKLVPLLTDLGRLQLLWGEVRTRIRSGQVGSGYVGSGWVGSGQVGSGQELG